MKISTRMMEKGFTTAFFDSMINWRTSFLFFEVPWGRGATFLFILLYGQMTLGFPFGSLGATSSEACIEIALPFLFKVGGFFWVAAGASTLTIVKVLHYACLPRGWDWTIIFLIQRKRSTAFTVTEVATRAWTHLCKTQILPWLIPVWYRIEPF